MTAAPYRSDDGIRERFDIPVAYEPDRTMVHL